MGTYTFTEQARALYEALVRKGLMASPEHNDGHKRVDIAIIPGKIYIEIDGLQHFTDPKQIEADFSRDHHSDVGHFDTIRIPNIIIKNHLDEVVNAIAEVVAKRIQK